MKRIIENIKEPRIGNIKNIKRFAWLPTKIQLSEYGWLVWLEFYLEKYEYKVINVKKTIDPPIYFGKPKPTKYIDVEKKDWVLITTALYFK